jgi:hypothetical protein
MSGATAGAAGPRDAGEQRLATFIPASILSPDVTASSSTGNKEPSGLLPILRLECCDTKCERSDLRKGDLEVTRRAPTEDSDNRRPAPDA